MQVIKNNNVTSFDVDNTLVMWDGDVNVMKPKSLLFMYGDEAIYLTPHENHIRFLKECSLRGDFIEVWSKNGYQWAEKVVNALELEKYVNLVRSKPVRHIDDKENIEDIVGVRIYMGNE